MPASPASYATLGLAPGADRAAVDRAYRALMKRHHPDRGGDPARAASINHAYADITRLPAEAVATSPTDLAAALYARHQALHRTGGMHVTRKGPRALLWLVIAIALGGLAWVEREPLSNFAWDLQWRYFPPAGAAVADDGTDAAGAPAAVHVQLGAAALDRHAIVAAEAAARRALKAGGIGAAADASRRCYLDLQEAPSLNRYDRCVAFDDAVLLIGGFGVADRGGFSAGAVTARQLAAARMFDHDYDSIETRLDRIRLAMMHRLEASPDAATEIGG